MEDSRTSKAKKNILFGYTSKVLTIILSFIARAVFIQVLGEELLGVNSVFTNVIQVLSLAELGMNNIVGYSFYKPLAQNDSTKIAALINFYKKIYNGIALAVLVSGICMMPFLKYIINTETTIEHIWIVYIIFLMDTVFSYLFVYKGTLLQADQKGYIITFYSMLCNIICTLLQIVSLIIFKNIFIYLGIKMLMSLISNALTAFLSEKEYPYIRKKFIVVNKTTLSKEDKKDIVSTIKSGFIYKLSSILLNSTDNILISMIIGTVFVGYLTNYLTIINGISSFYTIIFTSFTAGIGNLVVTGTEAQKKQVFNQMLYISTWMAIIFSSCLLCLSDEFITLWIGSKYVMDKSVVLAKAVTLFLSCALQPLFSYREALGLYKKTKYTMLLSAVINIVLSIIMGYIWGVAGILFASIISMLATYVWYEPVLLYNDCFKCSSKEYFVQRLKDCIYLFILFLIMFSLNKFWISNSWIMWLIKSISYFIIANIYCFCIYGRKPEFKDLLMRVKIIK